MRKKPFAVSGLVFDSLVSGFASRPDAIAPASVSAAEYHGLSCNQTTSI